MKDIISCSEEESMHIRIGQKVAYPSQGICQVEAIEYKQVGDFSEKFYMLRLLANNSSIMIPRSKVLEIGIRPIINSIQCQNLLTFLSEDFEEPASDWKIRAKEFNAKIQSGDIFLVADVLKKLYYLSRLKSLSFRERRMFEKTKFLVVSEMAIVCSQPECMIEQRVDDLLEISYRKHTGQDLMKSSASGAIH
jgi:CarD family transcriptional regulator